MREAMKTLMKDPELRNMAKRLAPFTSRLIEEFNMLPEDRKRRLLKINVINELAEINDAKAFLEKEFNAKILVHKEDDPEKYDPRGKAQQAKPYKPAIYIELSPN